MRSLQSLCFEAKCDKPTKMDIHSDDVLTLHEMIDVWRLIDKYDIRWFTNYKEYPDNIFVNKEDWEKAKKSAANPKIFDACLASNGKFSGKDY